MRNCYVFSLALLLTLSIYAHSADLRGVSPVSDTILMVHFDEGHIDQGADEANAKAYISKLDIKSAALAASYSITSEDDARYTAPLQPTKVGRKSKAADTLSFFRPEKFVLDHWIYLVLPQPLQRGCTYTVRTKDQSHTFLFHDFHLRSETIHVNQIGFTPEAPKFAYLSHWMGDLGGANLDAFTDKPFHLVRVATNETVFRGKVAKRKDTASGKPLTTSKVDGTPFNMAKKGNDPKNFTEADVFQCDFSTYKEPGEYRVIVEGLGCSFPFEIENDIYRKAYYTISRGLFFQRAGVEKEVEPGLNYPRDHHPDDGLNAFDYDKNWRFIDKPDHSFKHTPTGALKIWGWYHDAGDWDGYPGHVSVTLTLLLLHDLAGEKFVDGQIGNRYKSNTDGKWVDEGKNGIPDLLDEASWLIEYYRRARTVGLQAGLTTGGVPGGYAGVDACEGGASWKDKRALKFSAEDPATTYQYAACAAWLATCLDKAAGGTNPESAKWITEARSAYTWAKENTRPGDEGKIMSQRMLASLCLYRVTKEAPYHEQFAADIAKDVSLQKSADGWSAPEWWEFAAGIYTLLPADFPGLNAELQKMIRGKVIDIANRKFVGTANERGYRMGFDWFKMHQLGTFSTPMLYQPAIAYKLTGDKKYLDVMHTTASYCLGGNPMNMVWMSGLGQRSVKLPFHPDSWALIDYNSMVYDNEILPGFVPYGSCESGDIFGPGYHFTGDEDFSRSSAYPDVESWPISEVRFENRYSIWGGEFTVTQTTAPSLFAYGFLCNAASPTPATSARPGVSMTHPEEKAVFKSGSDIALRVKTSAGVRRVEYYVNEHYIGESETPPFAFTWRGAQPGNWLITAKAFDASGRVSKPNDPAFKVDVKVRLAPDATAVSAEKVEILNPPKLALNPNAVWPLSFSISPLAATNQAVTWTSSDNNIAAVNSQGLLVAKAPGQVTITLKSKDGGHAAECRIQVANGAKR